jgi:hypothetical protein
MHAIIDRVAAETPLELTIVDISTDPALERLYGLEIPVLLINGHKAAKYRMGESELRRILEGRRRPHS